MARTCELEHHANLYPSRETEREKDYAGHEYMMRYRHNRGYRYRLTNPALQAGVCDKTPFPLSHCYASLSTLLWRRMEISPVGRNRPFFHILKLKGTIFGPFSRQSASSEWIKRSTTPQMGSCHTFPPVRPIGRVFATLLCTK